MHFDFINCSHFFRCQSADFAENSISSCIK